MPPRIAHGVQERVVERVDRWVRRKAFAADPFLYFTRFLVAQRMFVHRVKHELVGADVAAEITQKHERPVVRRAVLGLGTVAHEYDERIVEHRTGILGRPLQFLEQCGGLLCHVPSCQRQNPEALQVQFLVRVVVAQLVRGDLGDAGVFAANRAEFRSDRHHVGKTHRQSRGGNVKLRGDRVFPGDGKRRGQLRC